MNITEKNEIIRKNLSKIRKIRGLTQQALGVKLGLSAGAIGNYERGDRYIPGYLIHDLCVALDVPEQFIVSNLSTDIKNSDISNNDSKQLLQKIANDEFWKKGEIKKQIQTLQLLNKLLEDDYLELMLEEEKDNNAIKNLKEKIFDLFEELSSYGDISKLFKNYNQNFDLIYWTALFFFNYLIGQRMEGNKDSYFKDVDFIDKVKDVLIYNSYSAEIIAYEYDEKLRE